MKSILLSINKVGNETRSVFLQLIVVTRKIEGAFDNRFESNLRATPLATAGVYVLSSSYS